LIGTHDKAPIVAALIARTDFVNMQAIGYHHLAGAILG
jgi:hypothetical protein